MRSILRILVIRACAIGDFILNIPALRALAAQNPNSKFTLVGNPDTLSLAKPFIPIEAIHSIESPPWSRLFVEPLPKLDFDAAWIWMKDPTIARHLQASGVSDVFHHAAFPPPGIHAADHLLSTVGLPVPPLPDLEAKFISNADSSRKRKPSQMLAGIWRVGRSVFRRNHPYRAL